MVIIILINNCQVSLLYLVVNNWRIFSWLIWSYCWNRWTVAWYVWNWLVWRYLCWICWIVRVTWRWCVWNWCLAIWTNWNNLTNLLVNDFCCNIWIVSGCCQSTSSCNFRNITINYRNVNCAKLVTSFIPCTVSNYIPGYRINNISRPGKFTGLNIIFMKRVAIFVNKLNRLRCWNVLRILLNRSVIFITNSNSVTLIPIIQCHTLDIIAVRISTNGNHMHPGNTWRFNTLDILSWCPSQLARACNLPIFNGD